MIAITCSLSIRETLTKEIEQLEADVVFLQGCLDNAADMRSCGGTPALSREPTITGWSAYVLFLSCADPLPTLHKQCLLVFLGFFFFFFFSGGIVVVVVCVWGGGGSVLSRGEGVEENSQNAV